jgi:hypothetical protein
LHIAVIFWLPAVELNILDMCDHLTVLPVVVSHDIQRASGSLFETVYRVYRHDQKLFSMNRRCSSLRE